MVATVLVRTPEAARTYPLSGTLTIGRAPENDIRLDNIDVSRFHGTLSESPSGILFVDLGSANGSRVNGREAEPRVPVALRPGDRVEIADCVLELTGVAPGHTPPPIPAASHPATMVAARQPAGGLLPGVPQSFGSTMPLVLRPRLFIQFPAGTREVPLDRDEMTLGRDPGNDIFIPWDAVSRRHLIFRRQGATFTLQDVGTTNGVRLRGQPVGAHTLVDGDVLDIAGEVFLRFSLLPMEESAPAEQREVALDPGRPVTIGRDPRCDLQLAHPIVSQFHARISPGEGGRQYVEDLGSTNGTFVNGMALLRGERRPVGPHDIIQIGPVVLHATGVAIHSEDHSRNIRLSALRLNQWVNTRLNLLQDISVVIEPQEFVAVVGVSGAGKSTLLGALSGLKPASEGDVLLNGTSLYTHFQAFRTTLGYVPQDDILHAELPVQRALNYAAELRLPDDTPAHERYSRVETVLGTLGLKERKDTPVGRLSGGQRKRVSIGAELLTQPGLFFLDEATSGLDPGTESQLMRLLRKLADDGHTILLITHATKNVMLCDQVLFLAKGGHLAYFGPPDQALPYFEVPDFDGIYEKLEQEKSPEEWAHIYRGSPQYRDYIIGRIDSQMAAINAAAAAPGMREAPPAGHSSSAFRQLKVLSLRYFDIIRRDRVNFALLFLLAPALSLIDLVAWPGDVLNRKTGDGPTAMTMLFLSSLIPFLVGALSFVREIVKEAPIYARERAVSLRIWPYLGSKIAIGSMFALYHGAALFLVKTFFINIPGAQSSDFIALYVTLVLAVISGVMWALLISTLTRREEQAMMLVIGLVVLQVVFSGGLVPLSDMGVLGLVLGSATSTAWAFKALTAAAGLTTAGCSGDYTSCNIPGVQGLNSPETRELSFGGVNKQFGDVFGQDVFVCWASMIAIIVVLAVVLYVLQRRKDTL